jgi:peptidoglycan/xylan/chitin deacetylase (PgdA/CDA1 family)
MLALLGGIFFLYSINSFHADNKEDKTGIPVLMYHILNKGENNTISVDPQRFKEHMMALKKNGYQTITVFDLQQYLEKDIPLPSNPILITFDDGYISNYTYAYPTLKELNMKATIFVIGSRIFEEKDVSNGELEKITWKQAREMNDTITIQSHTWDSHSKKKSITGKDRGLIASRVTINGKLETQKEYEERVYKDLLKSKKVIESKMGYENISIAYPYGDHSNDTVRLAEKAGYKIAFTVKKGLVQKGDNLLKLNRITADGDYSGVELVNIINSY